jgi:hypothetical protein
MRCRQVVQGKLLFTGDMGRRRSSNFKGTMVQRLSPLGGYEVFIFLYYESRARRYQGLGCSVLFCSAGMRGGSKEST